MKVVERLEEFPTKVALKGLSLDAYQILQNVDNFKPVMRVALDGQNAAAVKRAFVAASKVLGGSVETRNAEGDAILVRWIDKPSTKGKRLAGAARHRIEHAESTVLDEMKRLWELAGHAGRSLDTADETTKRKMRISAKRNLSRRANK